MLVYDRWVRVPGGAIEYRIIPGDTGETAGGHWCGEPYDGGFVTYSRPLRNAASSFDHLVRLRLQTERHRNSQGFRGLQIDDELECGRTRHGEVGRLSALEDLVDVVSRERIMGFPYRAVSDQAALTGEIGNPVHRGQSRLRFELQQ